MLNIISVNNPAVKSAIRLKNGANRKKTGRFLIDGYREILSALEAGWELELVFCCQNLIRVDGEQKRIETLKKIKIIDVSEPIFNKMCYKEKPDGFLAIAKAKKMVFSDLNIEPKSLVIILERVEKPGNLGGILRTAYAVGVSAVILNDHQTDIYNPNVIRASEGHVFTQKIVCASMSETLDWLKVNQISSFAAATGGNLIYTQANFNNSSAIVLGSEALGLSPEWLNCADYKIKIPMRPGLDSLNVSVSAAVILFEALRQRTN